MSVAKVHRVNKARKDQGKCGNCGTELPAGMPYIWWVMGFRSNYKRKACTNSQCYPSASSRESSKFATIMAAQEQFATDIESLTTADDITAAVETVRDAVDEVRDEYQEALDQWEHGNEQMQEKADHYESQSYELDAFTLDEDEPVREDFDTDEDFDEAHGIWLDNAQQQARDVVEGIEQL